MIVEGRFREERTIDQTAWTRLLPLAETELLLLGGCGLLATFVGSVPFPAILEAAARFFLAF